MLLDVVATERISRSLANEDGRCEELVFAPAEREACARRTDRAHAARRLFAAREPSFRIALLGAQLRDLVH